MNQCTNRCQQHRQRVVGQHSGKRLVAFPKVRRSRSVLQPLASGQIDKLKPSHTHVVGAFLDVELEKRKAVRARRAVIHTRTGSVPRGDRTKRSQHVFFRFKHDLLHSIHLGRLGPLVDGYPIRFGGTQPLRRLFPSRVKHAFVPHHGQLNRAARQNDLPRRGGLATGKYLQQSARKNAVVFRHRCAVVASPGTFHDTRSTKDRVRLSRAGLAVTHDVDVDSFEEGINA